MASFNPDELGRVVASAVATFLSPSPASSSAINSGTSTATTSASATRASTSSSLAQQNTTQVCINI